MSEQHTTGLLTVEDRRNAPLKNVRIVSGNHPVAEVFDVHQRDYQGSFRGDHAAADAVDAIGLANARRLVVCWGYFLDTPTEEIEAMVSAGKTYRSDHGNQRNS